MSSAEARPVLRTPRLSSAEAWLELAALGIGLHLLRGTAGSLALGLLAAAGPLLLLRAWALQRSGASGGLQVALVPVAVLGVVPTLLRTMPPWNALHSTNEVLVAQLLMIVAVLSAAAAMGCTIGDLGLRLGWPLCGVHANASAFMRLLGAIGRLGTSALVQAGIAGATLVISVAIGPTTSASLLTEVTSLGTGVVVVGVVGHILLVQGLVLAATRRSLSTVGAILFTSATGVLIMTTGAIDIRALVVSTLAALTFTTVARQTRSILGVLAAQVLLSLVLLGLLPIPHTTCTGGTLTCTLHQAVGVLQTW